MVDIASFIPDFLPFGQDSNAAPVANKLPTYRQALANQLRDQELSSILSSYDPEVRRAYSELQSERVNTKGTAPYSKPVIGRGIIAAGESEPVTAEPEGNILQNFAGDVASIASVVNPIKLIPGLIHEAAALRDLPSELATNLSGATDPLQALGAIAKSPGFRLIPGSYLAGTLAPEGPGLVSGVQQHPLFSALDVLPYASAAARATPIVKAAEAAKDSQVAAALTNADLGLLPASTRIAPIRTAIENWHPSSPTGFIRETRDIYNPNLNLTADYLVPNKLGEITQGIGEYLRQAPVIQNVFDSTLRPRGVARIIAKGQAEIVQNIKDLNRMGYEQAGFDVGRFMDSQADLVKGLTDEDKLALSQKLERPASVELPDHLAKPYEDLKVQADKLQRAGMEAGGLGTVRMRRGDEVFTADIAADMNRRQEEIFNAYETIRSAHDEKYAQALDPNVSTHLTAEQLQTASPYLDTLNKQLADRDWQGALQSLQTIESTAKVPPVSYAQMRRQIRDLMDQETMHVPARWQSELEAQGRESLLSSLKSGEAPDWAKVPDEHGAPQPNRIILPGTTTLDDAITQSTAGVYAWMDPDQFKAFQSATADGLHDLMANYPDLPVYVPHVTPKEALHTLTAPPNFLHDLPVGAWAERAFMQSPGTTLDPYLALSHSARQLVERGVQERVGQYIVNNYGESLSSIRNRMFRGMGASLDDPAGLVSPQVKVTDEIAKEYHAFNPNTYMDPNLDKAGLNALANADPIMIPNDVYKALTEFANPRHTQFGKMLDPLMKTFRHSVLTLSPRFYINNITGGAIMTAAASRNPLTILKHAKDALALARNPEALTELRDGTLMARTSIRNAPPAAAAVQGMTEHFLTLKDTKGILSAYQQFEAGKFLRKTWDKIEGSAVKFNAVNDQFWQTLNFLEGRENALNRGLTETQAIQAGVEAGRRFFETWDTLTPAERSLIKSVIPFYGFTRNLLKFTLQYPSTHPTRLALLSSLAKAEEEDYGSGLPRQFSEALWLGDTDEKGKVRTINVGGMNPFQDMGSYASMLGFLTGSGGDLSAITRSVNPLISTTLKSLGVDTAAGTGDLYPDAYLDPVSGKIVAATENPLLTFANSVVPQSSVLTNLAGVNSQFKAMLQTNPEAAGRSLFAAMGIPTPVREIDVSKERIKSEITRYTASQQAQNEALKTGNWGPATAYPSLRPFFDSLSTTDPDKLRQFLLTDNGSALRSLKAGFVGSR